MAAEEGGGPLGIEKTMVGPTTSAQSRSARFRILRRTAGSIPTDRAKRERTQDGLRRLSRVRLKLGADDSRFAVCPRAPRLDAGDPVQVRLLLALAWHPMEPPASTAGRPLSGSEDPAAEWMRDEHRLTLGTPTVIARTRFRPTTSSYASIRVTFSPLSKTRAW